MHNNLTVLIVGGGAREHVLYEAIEKSPLVMYAFCTPGTSGISYKNRREVKDSDLATIVEHAQSEKVNLVVIGPEGPLVNGLVDMLNREGIPAFGPNAMAAELEGSKIFMKTRCKRWGIPTADFDFAGSFSVAERIIKKSGYRVIKADGICGGKGVFVAETEAEALEAAHNLLVRKTQGEAGAKIVIEECMEGPECSIMAFCDGENALLLPPARDYKRAFDGNRGPNTGGMGSYSPLPDVDDALLETIKERIILPTIRGMAKAGRPYHGVLYAGIMLTNKGPKLVEYNARFGDPEAQVVLPRIESDLVEYMLACTKRGGLANLKPLKVSSKSAVCVVLASEGYPGKYKTGLPIDGLDEIASNTQVFHAGTKRNGGNLYTSGGRVISVVGLGANLKLARHRANAGARKISFSNKFYRSDIAADV